MFENLRTYWSRRFEPEPGEDSEAQRQAALFRLSADLAAALDERDVCQRVVVGLHDTLGYDFVAFFLVEESTGDRVMIASVGFVDPPMRLKAGEGLSELAFLDGQLCYTPDVNQEMGYFYGMGGSEVDVTVRIGGEVAGVWIAESKQRANFGFNSLHAFFKKIPPLNLNRNVLGMVSLGWLDRPLFGLWWQVNPLSTKPN